MCVIRAKWKSNCLQKNAKHKKTDNTKGYFWENNELVSKFPPSSRDLVKLVIKIQTKCP